MALIGQALSEKKIFENGGRRTDDDGRTTDHGHPISSPCEPNGSGELNQRTNGPVNAHLRSAVYTNVIENSPSIGADEALGPFFFQNNQYTVHTRFSLQMAF